MLPLQLALLTLCKYILCVKITDVFASPLFSNRLWKVLPLVRSVWWFRKEQPENIHQNTQNYIFNGFVLKSKPGLLIRLNFILYLSYQWRLFLTALSFVVADLSFVLLSDLSFTFFSDLSSVSFSDSFSSDLSSFCSCLSLLLSCVLACSFSSLL